MSGDYTSERVYDADSLSVVFGARLTMSITKSVLRRKKHVKMPMTNGASRLVTAALLRNDMSVKI